MARTKEWVSDRLSTEERKELDDSEFGLPKLREFPLPDAAHVRAAEAYFRYASDSNKPELARNILKKAKEFGVHIQSPTILSWAEK
ncbi:hypothetical protein OCV73_04185 [Barnesiella propionica]|uniref:DUF6582 domain-containing protein n=1 Tax=Barnesiella propionica TaxID=2981781 RepID=UPI0011CCC8F4|nr:DUF6582 domain-containing protein [Barnesiella propionica]MCU6768144.1 hypothetical protein [Barnesiella propionica]